VHSDSRSPMLDTIDKLTEPTTCNLLDGARINVELALGKDFPFQKARHSLPVQNGYVVVNLLMCGLMWVTTLCMYQLMGVT
jgi:hypothetical protein